MRANQFINEETIGTKPKRPARDGSRPERGHEPQKRYVTDRKTGKQYDPDEEFDKLKNSDDFKAQMKRMVHKESLAETKRMSAQVRLSRAIDRIEKQSSASRQRGEEYMAQIKADVEKKHNAEKSKQQTENVFGSKPKIDWNKRAKELFNKGFTEQQVAQQLIKEGCPPRQVPIYVQAGQMESIAEGGAQGPTPKKVCLSSVSDKALGVSQLASCKSQGLRARDGKKSHLIGHGDSKVRVTVGGKKIKGKTHGGPLPDYGTRKGQ